MAHLRNRPLRLRIRRSHMVHLTGRLMLLRHTSPIRLLLLTYRQHIPSMMVLLPQARPVMDVVVTTTAILAIVLSLVVTRSAGEMVMLAATTAAVGRLLVPPLTIRSTTTLVERRKSARPTL